MHKFTAYDITVATAPMKFCCDRLKFNCSTSQTITAVQDGATILKRIAG